MSLGLQDQRLSNSQVSVGSQGALRAPPGFLLDLSTTPWALQALLSGFLGVFLGPQTLLGSFVRLLGLSVPLLDLAWACRWPLSGLA